MHELPNPFFCEFKKKYFSMSSSENITQHVKRLRFLILSETVTLEVSNSIVADDILHKADNFYDFLFAS